MLYTHISTFDFWRSLMIKEVFRAVHTADWHLGKILHDQDRHEEHTRFLSFLLETIKEKNIHALIIAGDIFDSLSPPPVSLRLYYEFLAEVYHTTKCAVVVTSGNHDSPAHLEAPKDILKALNIHVIGVVPDDPKDALIFLPSEDNPQLAIAALPFLRDRDLRTSCFGESQDEIRANIQNGIRKRYHDIANASKQFQNKSIAFIATGHLTVLGASKSESERDIHIGGLGVVNTEVFPELFSYIALGHLHRPQKVGSKEHLRYSGSPIPLSFSESHDKKEIRLLEFCEGALIKNEAIAIPMTRQLFQLKTSYNNLENTLNNFQPEPSELAHWIELIIKVDDSIGSFHDVIEKLTAGKPYKVIKTLIESTSTFEGLRETDSQLGHPTFDLLGNPQDVFIQRLDQAGIVDVDERAGLKTTFAELYELVTENQRSTYK